MIKRALLIISLIFLASLVLGIITWNKWIQPLSRFVLTNYQIELIDADIQRPGIRYLNVEHASISYLNGNSRLEAHVDQLRLEYALMALFKGKLEALIVEKLVISVDAVQGSSEPDKSKANISTKDTEIPLILPSKLLAVLPFDHIDVKDLEIRIPKLGKLNPLSGRLRLNNGQLNTALETPQQGAITIVFYADQQDTIKLDMLLSNRDLVSLNGNVSNNIFSAALNANLETVTELLDRYAILPPDYRLSGAANALGSIPINSHAESINATKLRGSGSFEITATTQIPGDLQLNQFSLSSDFIADNAKLTLHNPSASGRGDWKLPAKLADILRDAERSPFGFDFSLANADTITYDHSNQAINLGGAELHINGSHKQLGLETQLQIKPNTLNLSDGFNASAAFKLDSQLRGLTDTWGQVNDVDGKIEGNISVSNKTASLIVTPGAEVGIASLRASSLAVEDLNFRLADALEVAASPNQVTVNNTSITIDNAGIRLMDNPLTYENAAVSLNIEPFNFADLISGEGLDISQNPKIRVDTAIDLKGLALVYEQTHLSPQDLSIDLTYERNVDSKLNTLSHQDKIIGTFAGSDQNQQLQTRGEIDLNLTEQIGTLFATTESVTFNERDAFLPQLATPPPLPIDFTAGSFTAQTKITFKDQQLSSEMLIRLKELGGFYDTNLFNGINGELTISSLHRQPTIEADLIEIANIDVGTSLSNIRFGLKPLKSGVEISDLHAEIFGGRITQEQIVYEWAQPENYLVLNLHELQLNEILQLESGISGTGVLGGMIPIIISEQGISVRAGGVSAKSPGGVIRYESDIPLNPTAANAGLQLTLDALKNFHYTSLSTEIEYDYQGDLVLKASLQGRNPDLEETRPFHFNLNIMENIPTLLKALRFSQDLSDDLSRRINDFYTTKPKESTQ